MREYSQRRAFESKFKPTSKKRFVLYNTQQMHWNSKIDKIPIILATQDIEKWYTFRAQHLKPNQLYLWHVTQFDWVPLYSLPTGFLLNNLAFISYEHVNYDKLTNAKWVRQNSLNPIAIQQLLQKFNIPSNHITQMVPIINPQNGNKPARGQPYYLTELNSHPRRISFYYAHFNDWGTKKFFNQLDFRCSYEFVKNYQYSIHQNDNPKDKSQARNIAEAIQGLRHGCYIYHEKEYYIPFKIGNGHITFNRGNAMEINRIKSELITNRIISSDVNNRLIRIQYERFRESLVSLFINERNGTYRIEFIINHIQTIPYDKWEDRSFKNVFGNFNENSTFMLLNKSHEYGVPIGIEKGRNRVILNTNERLPWGDFKMKMAEDDIITYLNLDFGAYEPLMDGNRLNNHFKPPCQQIAMVDIDKLCQTKLLSWSIGQYVLLDFGTDIYLPIYILSAEMVRTSGENVLLKDIKRFVDYRKASLIKKKDVENSGNIIMITTENCALSTGWDINTNAPNLNNIPQGTIAQGGIMTTQQAALVSAAAQNAQNRVSDRQQFRNAQKQGIQQQQQQQSQQQPQPPKQMRSAPSSPSAVPQLAPLVEIIPLLSIPQVQYHPMNQIEADKKLDVTKIMSHLEHDKIKILFPRMRIRVYPYCPKQRDKCAIFMMNYDYEQIIAALNDEEILKSLLGNINLLLPSYAKIQMETRRNTSLWDSIFTNLTNTKLIEISEMQLRDEMEQIENVFGKVDYVSGILRNCVRKIDCLRTERIMKVLTGGKKEGLIKTCTNRETLLKNVKAAQDIIHRKMKEACNALIQQEKQDEQKQRNEQDGINGNENELEMKDENKNGNDESKDDTKMTDPNNTDLSQNPLDDPNRKKNFGLTVVQTSQTQSQPQVIDLNPLPSVKLDPKTSALLYESWHDKIYSHLRTYQWWGPAFSNRGMITDHSSNTKSTRDSDPQFNVKDMVTHIASTTYNNPNDHIRLRFSSSSIDIEKGQVDFILKFTTFIRETKGVFSFIQERDYVTLNYRINDFDFAQRNDENIYKSQMREWNMLNDRVGQNFQHPNHPGPPPVFKDPSILSFEDKVMDTSNSTYHIQDSKGDSKPIRKGIIQWNENVQFNNYVDIFFQHDAHFAKQHKWAERMVSQFEQWQQQRQNLQIDTSVEMDKDVQLTIIKPSTSCTIKISIPVAELEDDGNPVKLYDSMVNIFKHHNHLQRKLNKKKIIPIENIKTITRSKKNRDIIDKVWDRWSNWKKNNSNYYGNMQQMEQIKLQEKRLLSQVVTGNIFVQFDKWIDELPEKIDYALGGWPITLVTKRLTPLERRMRSFHQCKHCGGIECRKDFCYEFNRTRDKIAEKNGISKKAAQKCIGKFCQNCGQIGGHIGKCEQKCRFCGKHDHNSLVHPECPYWNGWGILTMLFNDYFTRNQVTIHGHQENTNKLDSFWIMKEDFEIKLSGNNQRVFKKLQRQLQIIKYLCKTDDFYCTTDKNIQRVDSIHKTIKNNLPAELTTTSQTIVTTKKNESQDAGDIKSQPLRSLNNKQKHNQRRRHRRKKKDTSNPTKFCFNCEIDINKVDTYKLCSCKYTYCDGCWDEIFANNDEIKCYGCLKEKNGDMNIISNKKTDNQSDDSNDSKNEDSESDSSEEETDWENETDVESDDSMNFSLSGDENEINKVEMVNKQMKNFLQKQNKKVKKGKSRKRQNPLLQDNLKYTTNRKAYKQRNRQRNDRRHNFKNFNQRKVKQHKKQTKNNNTKLNKRIKRKMRREKREKEREENEKKRQQEKKIRIQLATKKREKELIEGHTTLTMTNLKYIPISERKTAIGNRYKFKLEQNGIETTTKMIASIITEKENEELIEVLYDNNKFKILLGTFLKQQKIVEKYIKNYPTTAGMGIGAALERDDDMTDNENENENGQNNNVENDEMKKPPNIGDENIMIANTVSAPGGGDQRVSGNTNVNMGNDSLTPAPNIVNNQEVSGNGNVNMGNDSLNPAPNIGANQGKVGKMGSNNNNKKNEKSTNLTPSIGDEQDVNSEEEAEDEDLQALGLTAKITELRNSQINEITNAVTGNMYYADNPNLGTNEQNNNQNEQ